MRELPRPAGNGARVFDCGILQQARPDLHSGGKREGDNRQLDEEYRLAGLARGFGHEQHDTGHHIDGEARPHETVQRKERGKRQAGREGEQPEVHDGVRTRQHPQTDGVEREDRRIGPDRRRLARPHPEGGCFEPVGHAH